jgi:predicted ATPase/class 3 adenylate cyclase/predicted negative regulator of RcsB-dependent stress response
LSDLQERMAIMFTDIEGSTRMWEQDRAAMSSALAVHDTVSRSAVAENGGTVIKMIGDGMYAVFPDSAGALRAAVTVQRALADPAATGGLVLRVRCGMHVGLVEHRDNDVFGPPVNRAARIQGAAHGGQVLISQAMADDVAGRLPPDVGLRNLGAVRLRDLGAAEPLHQVLHPDLRDAFPALRSLEATPNNLSHQLTSFVGRERELAEAKRKLGETRLLTLLGMGGHGKTRLSLQIGADQLDAFPDGVWFLDLAPIQDPALVVSVAAQVLNLQEEPGKPILQTLCAHVKTHAALFIVDNCEHLTAACAAFAHALLTAAPGVRIIATSREALRVPGEFTYPVLPLGVPDRNSDAATLLRSEAVMLFVERAQTHKPGFAVSERNASAVAELVARLEGIPLAIELAAARVRAMSIEDINLRLKDRFKLLTGGSRVALERQQTLRALVQWSYDLLRPEEATLIDRLSVFSGGFDLTAAEAVAGVDPLDPFDVLDLVASLVEKSLLQLDEQDGGTRYGMLETIREFSLERLSVSGGHTAATARHCDYFLNFAKTARDGLQGAEQGTWIRRLESELDNIRAAITFAMSGGGDPVVAVKYFVALMRFWTLCGYATEGRASVRAALLLPAIRPPEVPRAFALYVGGVLATNQGDFAEAKAMLGECVDIRRRLDHPREVAAGLAMLAGIHLTQGEAAKARELAEDALATFRQLGEPIGEGIGLHHLGEICIHQDDIASARACFTQGLAIARSARHQELESDCERGLGDIDLHAGDLDGARAHFLRSESVCREAHDKRGLAIAAWRLAKADAAEGNAEPARGRLKHALEAFRTFAMNAETIECLEDYGAVLAQLGDPEGALCHYGTAAATRESLVVRRPPLVQTNWDQRVAQARAALDPERANAAWDRGRSTGLADAVERLLAGDAGKATAS